MQGPCAKRRVVSIIARRGVVLGVGENDAERPQAECPRVPGDGYAKCSAICGQRMHAERAAIADAQANGKAHLLSGATLHLFGHGHACDGCGAEMDRHGIELKLHDGGEGE